MSKQKIKVFAPYSETKILVDYFCFSIGVEAFCDYDQDKMQHLGERLKSKLFLEGLPWEERKGMYGYSKALYYDGIVLVWGGCSTVYCQMSGTGCRTWESLHPGLAWEKWIAYLQSTYGSWHCSRLDIACDTFGLLDLPKIQRYTKAEKFISRWKTYLIQAGTTEQSVIWGSSKSEFRCRIYDKTLERQVKAWIDPADIPKGWVRCEFQLRNDAASSFIRNWQRSGSIGGTFLGVLQNQLLYCSHYDGKNRDRAVVATWWAKLLGDTQRIKMSYTGGKEYNFESLKHYIYHQTAASLRTYLTLMNGDLNGLMYVVEHSKLNTKQTALINEHRMKMQEGTYNGQASDFEIPAYDRGNVEGENASG